MGMEEFSDGRGWWQRMIDRLRSARPDPDNDGTFDVTDCDDACQYQEPMYEGAVSRARSPELMEE